MATRTLIPTVALEKACQRFNDEPSLFLDVDGYTLSRSATFAWAQCREARDGLGQYIQQCQDVHLYGYCRHEYPCND